MDHTKTTLDSSSFQIHGEEVDTNNEDDVTNDDSRNSGALTLLSSNGVKAPSQSTNKTAGANGGDFNHNVVHREPHYLIEEKISIDKDPWALIDPPEYSKLWKEKTGKEKVLTALKMLLMVCLLLFFLYIFICSLDFLSNAFRLLGGKAAGEAFRANAIISNPIACLMMGVLATVLLQSSSTTTTITVAMVASEVMPVRPAIFIVMGANIGTSVTNTIVALGQAMNRNDFRRAFAGATVHDMFNWLSVLVLLPIEWLSGAFGSWNECGIICQITSAITRSIKEQENHQKQELLKKLTRPFSHLVIWVDQFVVTKIATWNVTAKGPLPEDLTLMKQCYKEVKTPFVGVIDSHPAIVWNSSWVPTTCGYLFEGVKGKWSDPVIGGVLLVFSLVVLLSCLVFMVKILQQLLQGSVAKVIKRFLNSNLPCGRVGKFLSGYLAIAVGAGITMVLQSSSVFTSALTPLVGVGVLHINRMYPLTLGANIGTTLTAILASLAFTDNFAMALQIALCHLIFNLLGVIIWYPIPFMRKVPINLAKRLGETTGKYRWFPGVYIALVFFLIPGLIFGLSVAGWAVLLGIAGPIVLIFIVVASINICQSRCPKILPSGMRDWSRCPQFLHSLEPYDKIFSVCCICSKKCKNKSLDTKKDYYMGEEPETIQINMTEKV